MQPMKPARYEELREIHDARLQAAAFAWTGGLGVWALDNADANFLKYFQRVRFCRYSVTAFHAQNA